MDALDLEIDEGELVVLVGPSGCGKTTTMRMINRMTTPSSGSLTVDGRDVTSVPPPELRRGIGYVIQHAGLFPHKTIADNIATVPLLLGWDKDRVHERVDELVGLVGLDEKVGERYPHQLSGGQRQRVGVARALAADPPVLLMDEPFGAVDPIVRVRLQDELLKLQRELAKTIVFVTHDIDEALRLGDKIAVLSEGGQLEQFASPREMLSDPATAFVSEFLGDEQGLKRLSLIPVSEVEAEAGPVVSPDDDTARANEVMRTVGTDWASVVDDGGVLSGWVSAHELEGHGRMADQQLREWALRVEATDSLRAALNAMITSRTGAAVCVGQDGRYQGIITQDVISKEIR